MRKDRPLEKDFLARFTKRVKRTYPQGFYYKIPDTKGLGGMRPFDSIWFIQGKSFCLEFKRSASEKVTEYQKYSLNLASQNGPTDLVVFPENADKIYEYIKRSVNR